MHRPVGEICSHKSIAITTYRCHSRPSVVSFRGSATEARVAGCSIGFAIRVKALFALDLRLGASLRCRETRLEIGPCRTLFRKLGKPDRQQQPMSPTGPSNNA